MRRFLSHTLALSIPSVLIAVLLATILVPVHPALAADGEKKAKTGKTQPSEQEILLLMRMFSETFEQIERNYVKDVDRRRLVEAAIRGMLKELDQYSNYISPEQISKFNQNVNQQFGGIGIQVTPNLTVATPLPGSPAYKAGVKAGDRIVEIGGKPTKGFPSGRELETAISLLKGKPGESITLGLQRSGTKDVIKVTVTRAIIQVATVLGDHYGKDDQWNYLLDDKSGIGYVRVTHFARRTADELEAALVQLKKKKMKGLIIDLRFNPGGLLSQATRISDMFIEKGRIVSTKGRNIRERVWDASKSGTHSGFPIAVLVNHFSASASEIVSACLQDHKRAVIVGERTWGKGSVQNVIELEGGGSALKLTTASYHRPSGRNIHRFPNSKTTDIWGVTPDEGQQLAMSRIDMIRYQEYRRQRDVLKEGGPPKSDFIDKQLAKAVEHLTKALANPPAASKKKNNPPASRPSDSTKSAANRSDRIARFLFKKLDKDKDGKLSGKEWQAAPQQTRSAFEKKGIKLDFPVDVAKFSAAFVASRKKDDKKKDDKKKDDKKKDDKKKDDKKKDDKKKPATKSSGTDRSEARPRTLRLPLFRIPDTAT